MRNLRCFEVETLAMDEVPHGPISHVTDRQRVNELLQRSRLLICAGPSPLRTCDLRCHVPTNLGTFHIARAAVPCEISPSQDTLITGRLATVSAGYSSV